MGDFSYSLPIGKQRENQICDLIKRKYPSAYVVAGYKKEYDIVIPEISKTVEVKQDYQSKYTGNILVECEFDGRPSGLSTTTADYWVFIIQDHLVWVTPTTLFEIIRQLNLKPASFIGKGDTKEKKAYLIPSTKIFYSPYASLSPFHLNTGHLVATDV